MTILKKFNLFLIFSFLIFFTSCGCSNTSEASALTEQKYITNPVRGKVVDSLTTNGIGSPAYTMYLPSNYSVSKKYPCIFFFDAHARAALPLNRYKDIAEKYGYILIGCYSSRNGIAWDGNHEAILTLMKYIQESYAIDTSRIYLSGFSGGSRVAANIASELNIAGLIGIAAGYASNGNMFQHKFNYFGIVGDYDFNYTEMKQLDAQLTKSDYNHQLLTLSGNHGWPSKSEFEMAVLWMQSILMKNKIIPTDNNIINNLKKIYDDKIENHKRNKEWSKVLELMKGEIEVFEGVIETGKIKNDLNELMVSNDFKSEILGEQMLMQQEVENQNKCKQMLFTAFEDEIIKMVKELKQKATSGSDIKQQQMYQRVLNYLDLIIYLTTDGCIKNKKIDESQKFLRIFKIIDATNADIYYLESVEAAEKGDVSRLYSSLNNALKLGYNQPETIMFNPVFKQYLDQKEMIDLLKQFKALQN